MVKLVVGCGYLGLRVARRWLRLGHEVIAVTRSPSRAEALGREGIRAITRDITDFGAVTDWPRADTVLFAVGFDRSSGLSIRQVYVDGLGNVLSRLPDSTGRFIYVSSTGVYGQSEGEWVDEQSPCVPTREGGRACLEAERLLAGSIWRDRSTILRLAGIYGPGRVPRRGDIEAGAPIPAADGMLNLIHVEDAAEAVLAVDAHPRPSRLYNVADGAPTRRKEYFRELARLLRAPEPRFAPPDDRSPRAERAIGNKRIRADRIREELSPRFRFPSYREGLAAIVADEKASQ